MKRIALILTALTLPLSFYAQNASVPQKKLIVSPKYPVDSLGETVYERQGEDEQQQKVVPGAVTYPIVQRPAQPEYSEAMRRAKYEGDVTVDAVVAASGRLIDLEAEVPANPEAAKAAIRAVRKYKFSPATLDSKPIAMRMKVIVSFRLY